MSILSPIVRRRAIGALAVFALAACGGSDDPGPGGSTEPGGITLNVGASAGVSAGASTTVAVTVGRTGSFAGPIDITVEGVPAGVTATASPAQIPAGSTSSTINISAAANVAAATATVTVRARGNGVADRTATFALNVQAAPTAGAFSLAAAPAALSVQAGTNATSTINITRTAPFVGAVGLAVTGAPAGVTATINPTSATAGTATLTVAVAAGTPASTGTLTITGTGVGVANATTTVALTTTAAPAGGGSITFRFCEAPLPVWLAVQDGTGAWTRVNGTNGTYSFDITAARGGVAWAEQSGASVDTYVFYGTRAEIVARGTQRCLTATGKTVTGTVAGLGMQDQAYVTLGTSSAMLMGASGSAFTLTGVPDGARDLVASRVTFNISGSSFSMAPNKMVIRRGINPAAGSALPVIDFNNEGFAPATAQITANNTNGEPTIVTGLYTTANGSSGSLYLDATAGGATRTYYGVPAAQQVAGDLHFAQISALPNGWENNPLLASSGRSAGIFFGALANQTVTLGPALATPTVTVAGTTPYVRLRAVLTRQTEYDQSFSASFSQDGASSRTVSIEATAGYIGTGSFDVTIPDLTAAQYDASWGLRTGAQVTWTLGAYGWSAGTGVATPTAGVTVRTAMKAGQLTP